VKTFRRPRLEELEDRTTPSTLNLTVSFVPDGTIVTGTQTSQMFKTLNAQAPTAVWEADVLNDLHTLPALATDTFTVVADNGAPMTTAGAVWNDPRFGDIRIGGVANIWGSEDLITSSRLLLSGPTLIDPTNPGAPATPPPSGTTSPGTWLPSLIDLGTYQWGKAFLPIGTPVGTLPALPGK
jgi:hypothetical protein